MKRSASWRVGGAIAAALLVGGQGARAQDGELGWYAHEDFESGTDQAIELAYCVDGPDRWVYAAGYVTDGAYTRLAVWKYQADAPDGAYGQAEAVAYFPPLEEAISGNTRATGIAIDTTVINGQTLEIRGDVYVTGYTQLENEGTNWPQFGTDRNYITLKFDKNLSLNTWSPQVSGAPSGFRLFDHEGLDDAATDIIFSDEGNPMIYVTGSSKDTVTAEDITTLKIEGSTGSLLSHLAGRGRRGGGPAPVRLPRLLRCPNPTRQVRRRRPRRAG